MKLHSYDHFLRHPLPFSRCGASSRQLWVATSTVGTAPMRMRPWRDSSAQQGPRRARSGCRWEASEGHNHAGLITWHAVEHCQHACRTENQPLCLGGSCVVSGSPRSTAARPGRPPCVPLAPPRSCSPHAALPRPAMQLSGPINYTYPMCLLMLRVLKNKLRCSQDAVEAIVEMREHDVPYHIR
jgi:hypothetical protein